MSRTVSLITVAVISAASYLGLSSAQSGPNLSPLAQACLHNMESKEQVVAHCRAFLASNETGTTRGQGAFRLGYHLPDEAWQEAIEAYGQSITHNPQKLAAYYNRGRLQADKARDYPAAIKDFSVVVARSVPGDKFDRHIWNLRGKAYQRNEQHAEAAADFEQSLQRVPDHTGTLYRLGNAHKRAGNRDAARAAYERILRLKPDHPRALLRRAEIDFDTRNFERALTDHLRAARLAPQDRWLNARVENFYVSLAERVFGLPYELFELAETGLKIAPQEPALLNMRAMAYVGLESYSYAMADIDAAIALAPNAFIYQYNRAVITLTRGDTLDAVTQLDALAEQLAPHSAYVKTLAVEAQRLYEVGEDSSALDDKMGDIVLVRAKTRRLRESLSDW